MARRDGTGNLGLTGSGSRRPDLQAAGREIGASRRSGIAAALLLVACWGAPPLLAAAPRFQSQRLIPDHLDPGDRFGSALAMGALPTGDGVVAVGAYLSAAGGSQSGAVFLFLCPAGGTCRQAAPPLSGAAGDWFGFDVAIDGTRLLVGAPRAHDGSGARTGAAYQFDLSDLEDGQVVPQGPLPLPPGHAGDEVGSAVALSSAGWAVGARSDGQAGAGAGSVYACCIQGQVQKLLPGPPARGAQFGQSVSLDGGILAVGAPLAEPAGAAYVFTAGETAWQEQPLPAPAAVPAGAAFGYAVALSGNQLVVGAPLDAGNGTEAGAAYLYSLAQVQGSQGLPQPVRLQAGVAPGAQLGVAMAFDRLGQKEIVAGARLASGGQGAAYLFRSNGTLDLTLMSPQPQAGANFGFEAAIRDGAILVGAFLQDGGAGAAYLFAPAQPVPPVPSGQTVTVRLAAGEAAFPESAGTVQLPLVVATSDGRPTAAPVTVQVEAIGAAAAGAHFQLLTHQVAVTIPQGRRPGVAGMAPIAFLPDLPCMGDETFTARLHLDPTLDPPGAALGAPSTERVTLHDDLAGLAVVLAHPPVLMTGDDGAADQFTVALCSQPTAAVAVGFIGAAGYGVTTPSSLVFTPGDWNQPQTVTVRSVDDPACLGDLTTSYAIELTTASADARYSTLSPSYSVTVADQHHDSTEIVAGLTVGAACDGTVLYTLALTNLGKCALDEVPSTQLVDALSWDDLSLVSATADRGTVSVDYVANRVAWSGAIPPGARATILFNAAIQAGVVAGQAIGDEAALAYASRPGGPGDTMVTTSVAFDAPAPCPVP
jgi:hypothetical protein